MATSFASDPGTSSLRPVPPDPALESALAGLVTDGTLSAEQAHAVRARRAGLLVGTGRAAVIRPVPDEAGDDTLPARHNPLPEILGYVGAALVGSALLNLVLQSWETWSGATRLAVTATVTVSLYAAGLATMAAGGWRHGLAAGRPGPRRVVALLMAVGAVAAGLTAVVAAELAGYGGAAWLPLAGGCVALAAAALGAWAVRAVLSTLAAAAGAAWVMVGLMTLWPAQELSWWLPLVGVAGGTVWLLLGPRLLALPVLSEALGWAFLLQVTVPFAMWGGAGDDALTDAGSTGVFDAMTTQAWVARGLLVLLAVVGMLVFLRGGRWPWAAGGVAAGVFAALAIGGQTLSWIMTLLVAGVVLLLLSAVLVVVRRRRDGQAATQP